MKAPLRKRIIHHLGTIALILLATLVAIAVIILEDEMSWSDDEEKSKE